MDENRPPGDDSDLEESLEESLLREEQLELTEDVLAAIEEGLPYSPPDEPPVRPGGRDDALIEPSQVGGAELLPDILDALAANPVTAALKLEVEVHSSHVILRGGLSDPADAEAAVGTVLAVPGVQHVVDRIWLLD
jgi:hypothetical protein